MRSSGGRGLRRRSPADLFWRATREREEMQYGSPYALYTPSSNSFSVEVTDDGVRGRESDHMPGEDAELDPFDVGRI